MFGNVMAQEVTLDFTPLDNPWGIPTENATAEASFSNGGYTIKLSAPTSYKINKQKVDNVDSYSYIIMGKKDAALTLPTFSFDVEKIEVEGNSGASASVKQNIFVGENAVSTETTSAKVTNTYMIKKESQAAGNVYVLKVTNAYNTQITKIKIYKASGVTAPEISGSEVFNGSTQVTITADEGAAIYYTTDGSEPSSNSLTYSAPFTINSSCTVKAIASKGGVLSSVVSKSFVMTTGDGSETNPFTIADMLSLPSDYEATDKWVKGIIVGSIKNNAVEETPTVDTNLALATAVGEKTFANIVPVQLSEANKAALNVVDNASNIGKELQIHGDITKYFGNLGVKNTTDYKFAGGDTPSGDGLVGIYRPLNLTAESGPEVGDCATKTDCGVTVTAIKGTAVTYREEAGQETAYTTDLYLGYSLTTEPAENKASATVYAPNEVIFPNVAEQTSRQDEEYFGFKMEIPEGKSININGLDVQLISGNAYQWMVEITDAQGTVVYATQNVNNKGIKINNYNKTCYTNGVTVSRTEVTEPLWSQALLATWSLAANYDVADTPVMPALDNLTGTYFVKVYYWGKWKKNLTYADVFLSVSQGATGIEAVKAANAVKADNVMYNLAGQKVDAAYKGMVIMNGRKFVNK